MIVFKTFLKVLKSYKMVILMYTVFLVIFGTMNMKTSDNNVYTNAKPDVLIINNDKYEGITKSLIDYISNNVNIVEIKNDEDSIKDALFYRDVNYIIYIPDNYNNALLDNEDPVIEIKNNGNYESSLSDIILKRYLSALNTYRYIYHNEKQIINKVEESLLKTSNIQLSSKIDSDNLSNATFYFNFMNYSLLAGSVYIIGIVLSSFRKEMIKKRTLISSIDYKKYNLYLLISNILFSLLLWLIYVLLSFILVGKIMYTNYGLIYILNSFIFCLCSTSIGFMIANMTNNKGAINGIVNVISLGSSFLCGAFVPMELLPKFVLKIAHVLPSYWFIKSNELLKTIENLNISTISPILINMGVVIMFSIAFVVITNILQKNK